MPDQIRIQVNFTRQYNGIQFSDALYFTQEEYQALSPAALSALQDQRFNQWVGIITNPPTVPPPVKARTYTKFAFRNLFTQSELITIDNYDLTELPAEAKAAIRSFLFSFQVADEVELDDPATQAGVNFLADCGLITPERAATILS